MKKKLLFVFAAAVLWTAIFGVLGVSAAKSGIYTYGISNGKAEITDCDPSAKGNIVIPSSLGGCPVTSIGYEAFRDCTGLISVTIPEGVTSIGSYAFDCCTGLTSVTIPDSVTSIGDSAFGGCNGLTGVYITDIAAWCAIDFDSFPANPLYYANNLYLNGALVTDLVIPKGVTSIGNYAFWGCTGLTGVTIPDSVTSIGDRAFWSCTGLTAVTIPKGVTSIEYAAFYGCTGLNGVTIPDSVTSIGNSAFEGCNKLVYADIGSGVSLIPEKMFYNCKNLRCVGLSAGVKYVRNDAFNYCENLETVFYADSASRWNEILFYNRNENLTNANIIYHAKKKTYRFETNCSAVLEAVTDYAVFTMPEVENEGKTFRGWYDNRELSGSPVTFPYYGGAAVLYAAWTDKTGADFDDALATRANQEYTVTTTESDQLVYFEFVPSRSKEYHIYTTGSRDTYGYLYNSKRAQIASDDDAGDGNNFYISHALTAGERYYIAAKVYRGAGTFTLVVEEPVDYRINAITIKDMAGNGLQEIPRGTFLATVSFTNVSAASDAVIVLARYTETGAFEGLMHIQTEDVPKGSTIKLSIPVDNEKGDGAKLKAFCWDSSGALKPMGNTAAFPAE